MNDKKTPSLKSQGYVPVRYMVALMMMLGNAFNFILRFNINFAIVAMVKSTNLTQNITQSNDVCGFEEDIESQKEYDGPFSWTEWDQGLVIGSFYVGYTLSQIPGGRLAELYGGHRVFGLTILMCGSITFFIPEVARWNFTALIALRAFSGMVNAPSYPCVAAIVSTWSPPVERSFFSTIISSGLPIANIVAFGLSALIIESLGWEAVFYIHASFAIVWAIIWLLFVPNSPQISTRISSDEKKYIIDSIGDSKSTKPETVPLRQIIVSMPFWAIIVAHVGCNWGHFTLQINLPTYMKNMLKQDINSNALFSSLPFLAFWIWSVIVSGVGDWLRSRGIISTLQLRLTANTFGLLVPAICLACISFLECNRVAIIAMFFVAIAAFGSITAGFLINSVDLSPNFSATINGMSNTVANIPGFIEPIIVGALTNHDQSFAMWNHVFRIAVAFYVFSALFYLVFARTDEQPWNKIDRAAAKKELPKVEIGKPTN